MVLKKQNYPLVDRTQKLNNEHINSCNGRLSEYECCISLSKIQNNKSPGSGGLTVEFYKSFWKDVANYLTRSIVRLIYGNFTNYKSKAL